MEVGDHRAKPLVEGVLEALDLAAVIDAALEPRAVGAFERELPAGLCVLAPRDRSCTAGRCGAGVPSPARTGQPRSSDRSAGRSGAPCAPRCHALTSFSRSCSLLSA